MAEQWGVALRKESVDRNSGARQMIPAHVVALRKESVDRNVFWTALSRPLKRVALRKESVDRNNTEWANIRACISRSPQGERG